jgi:outer membrane protein assembly factor BamD (BamD/ComL family)
MTKHELKEDAFSTAIFTAREWAETNLRLVLIVLGAVVLVGASVWGFFSWRASNEEAAKVLYGQAGVEIRSGNPPAAIATLQKLLDEHGKSSVAGMGCFQLAQMQFRQRSFDDARATYQRYLSDYGNDPLLSAGAWAGQAAVDEQTGFFSDAIDKYEKAYRANPTGFEAPTFVRKMVRAAISANDSARALSAYELLQKEFPSEAADINTAKQFLIERGYLDPNKS